MELSVSHEAMPARPGALRRPGRRDQKGTALLEFAIVAPIFFFILYALVVFGMALALKQSVTNAAAEAARSAVGCTSPCDPVAKATATANSRLSWLSTSQKASLVVTVPAPTTCSGGSGTCITVTVKYPYSTNPLVPSAPIISQIQPKTISSIATVQIS